MPWYTHTQNQELVIKVEKGKKGRGIIYSGECNHCQNRVSGKFNGKGFENISVDKN